MIILSAYFLEFTSMMRQTNSPKYCSRSFYYQIHFIAEPSSNVQVNNNSERKLRYAHQEDDSNNDSIPDDAYDRDDDNDEDSYDRNDDYNEDTYDRNDNNNEDTYDRDDNNDEDTYDRDNDHDKNDDADEDLIRQKHGLRNDDDYLENASEGDEDEADFDSDDDDFDVSEKEKDNLSDENDPQNNPKACKKKSFLFLQLQNLLDPITMKATLVWKCPLQKKMKFSIKDFFSKCDQICRKLRIWSRLPKKSLMENFISCAVSKIWF